MTDRQCSIPGCDGTSRARGWCFKHYQRWKKYGDPRVTALMREQPKKCRVAKCRRKPPFVKGLCHMHYQRFKRWGDPNYTIYTHDPGLAAEIGRNASNAVVNHVAGRRTDGRTHGKSSTYDWGCRCDLCRIATRDRRRVQRAQLKARRELAKMDAALLPSTESIADPLLAESIDELAQLIIEQDKDAKRNIVGSGRSLDAMAEYGREAAYFDRDDDEDVYEYARSRKGVKRSEP